MSTKNLKQEAQNIANDLAAEQVQIAIVDSYDSGASLVYITRIGQPTPDAQGYPHLTSYMNPAAGGTVVLRRLGSGWFVEGDLGPPTAAGTGGGTLTVHGSAYHTGIIGSHDQLSGVNGTQHSHPLVNGTTNHTVSGLNAGEFLRATSGTTYAFTPVTAGSIGAAGTAHASTHYEGGSDALSRVSSITKKLTNKSGSTVNAGDLVIITEISVASAFSATGGLQTTSRFGVVGETILNNAVGLVYLAGYCPAIAVVGTVTVGEYLVCSATSLKATGVSGRHEHGVFGYPLETGTGTIAGILYGETTPQWEYDLLLNREHAAEHASAGNDPLAPADIGAADTSHAGTHATGGGDAITPASIDAASEVHNLIDTTGHPVSGLTAKQFLRATSATAYAFQSVTPDDMSLAPTASVTHNTTQSIANATVQALVFNTERYDNAAFHSTVTNTDRLTAPSDGLYAIWADVAFAAHATGYRFVLFSINGLVNFIGSAAQVATGGAISTRMPLYVEWPLDAGQYVLCSVYQDSGGALNVNNESLYSPNFGIRRLGPKP